MQPSRLVVRVAFGDGVVGADHLEGSAVARGPGNILSAWPFQLFFREAVAGCLFFMFSMVNRKRDGEEPVPCMRDDNVVEGRIGAAEAGQSDPDYHLVLDIRFRSPAKS